MINRFVIICLLIFAVTNAFRGMYIQSLGDVSAAFALQCESCEKARPFFTIAAISNLYKMRFIGFIGFILAASGKLEIAEKILALHYGLVGIDDSSIPPIARFFSFAAGASLAM